MGAAEERYVKAYEDFANECAKNGNEVKGAEITDKDAKIGYYIVTFGENALEQYKADIQSGAFNYNKMNAQQKEVYSSLNYVKNTNERDKRLIEGVNKLMNGEDYADFLKFNAKFHNYSFNNKILIYMQKPDASYVAGLGKWKSDFGAASIAKGEKGIMISRPNLREFKDEDKLKEYMNDPKHAAFFTEKEKEAYLRQLSEQGKVSLITSFSYASVWDVSQMRDKEGNKLKLEVPEIRKQIGADYKDYETVKQALTNISEVPIEYVDTLEDDPKLRNAYGYYSPVTDTISVRNAGFKQEDEVRSEQDCIRTTIHEMAHSMLHGPEMRAQNISTSWDARISNSTKEIEAESVAFMVCDHLGIDSSCNTFGYLAKYLPDDPDKRYMVLDRSMKNINKCADAIIERLDKELEKLKTVEKPETEEEKAPYDAEQVKDLLKDLSYMISENLEGMDATEVPDLYDAANDGLEKIDELISQFEKEDYPEADDLSYALDEITNTMLEITENAEEDFLNELDVDIDELLKRSRELIVELDKEEEIER